MLHGRAGPEGGIVEIVRRRLRQRGAAGSRRRRRGAHRDISEICRDIIGNRPDLAVCGVVRTEIITTITTITTITMMPPAIWQARTDVEGCSHI